MMKKFTDLNKTLQSCSQFENFYSLPQYVMKPSNLFNFYTSTHTIPKARQMHLSLNTHQIVIRDNSKVLQNRPTPSEMHGPQTYFPQIVLSGRTIPPLEMLIHNDKMIFPI